VSDIIKAMGKLSKKDLLRFCKELPKIIRQKKKEEERRQQSKGKKNTSGLSGK